MYAENDLLARTVLALSADLSADVVSVQTASLLMELLPTIRKLR